MTRILLVGISVLFSIIIISGISLADAIECDDYQREDGKIICISSSTAEKLINRGWDIILVEYSIVPTVETKESTIHDSQEHSIVLNDSIKTSDKIITENQSLNYILNPENISELIPQDITFPSVIDMPINDTAAMAKKIMEWTGDKDIVNIRESDTRISYETSSFGKVSFNKVLDNPTEIHITLRYPYQIKQENSEQASRDLMEYLGMDTKYISEHRPREYTNDVKQSFFQKKDGLFVDSNSFYGNFYGGSTDFYINKWNHNLDEMNLIDVEIAKETAQNYVMDNDENLNNDCKDDIFKTDRSASIVMIKDRPIYKVETDGCDKIDERGITYNAYVDAITGKPLFVKTYKSF